MKPIRPSEPIGAMGSSVPGVRFDGEDVQIREPGMPVSPSRSWQREIGNFAATSLNDALGTDDQAPAARTIVSFDLASPSVLQIGIWKEMTITMTSTLPDGTVVRSEPVVGNIDDTLEYATVTGMSVGATVLDITAGVASIYFFIFDQSFLAGAVFIGALLGSLTLNIAQSSSSYFVAASEEGRWSDLFATAIRAHASDVRAQIGTGPPAGALRRPLPSTPLTPTPSPLPPPLDPAG